MLRTAACLILVVPVLACGAEEPEPEAPAVEVHAVAQRLDARRGVLVGHALVVAFDAPPGDGRRGGKGVVVRSAPEWFRDGTLWMLRYARSKSAFGLQIIHPFRFGQVIVHISKTQAGISTPRSWVEVGYYRGYARELKPSPQFAKVFPLKEDVEYRLVSRLSPDGRYRLQVNGVLVGTARVTAAHPLSFAIKDGQRFPGASGWAKLEFKGTGFPEKWKMGYAGLLVEPLDTGENAASDVRFAPGPIALHPEGQTDF